MTATLLIRKARPEDRDAIWRVHRTAIQEICRSHYAPHEIAAWTGRLSPDVYLPVIVAHDFLVAEHGGGIVGFAQLEMATSTVEAVYVDPRHTRRGFGTSLLRALELRARQAGLETLHLHASLNSVEFYEAAGFGRVAAATHELAPGVSIACVVMRKTIVPRLSLPGGALLRPWCGGDADALVRHANDYEVWRNLRDRFPHPYTRADADAWVRLASREIPPLSFAIVADGEAVGGAGLVPNDDIDRCSAEIGYWVGREFWGRGLATAAVRALTAHAFGAFPLTRIYAGVFAENAASIRVLEKAGYRAEGRLRRSVVKEGLVRDQMLYAIIDDDR